MSSPTKKKSKAIEKEKVTPPKYRLTYPLHRRNGRIGYKSSTGRSIFPNPPKYLIGKFRIDEEYREAHRNRKKILGDLAPPIDLYHEPLPRTYGVPDDVPEMRVARDKILKRTGTVKEQNEDDRYRELGFTHGFKTYAKEETDDGAGFLPEGTAFFKGMLVEVNYKEQGRWYTGRITKIHLQYKKGLPTTFDVRYEWGIPVEYHVKWKNIRARKKLNKWYENQTVIINYKGKGVWFTGYIAKVYNEKYNDELTIDVKYDGGFPKYETRIPFDDVRSIEWHVNQPVLANYKSRGRWVKADIVKIHGDVIWGNGTVTLRYTEWGDDRMEYLIPQTHIRPRIDHDRDLLPGPHQHLISLILSPSPSKLKQHHDTNNINKPLQLTEMMKGLVTVDSIVNGENEEGIDNNKKDIAPHANYSNNPNLTPTAWFWSNNNGDGMNMYGTSSHNLETMDEKKKKEKWILPEKKKEWEMPIRLTGYTLPEDHKFNQYDATGHKIPKRKKQMNVFEKMEEEKHKKFKKHMKLKKIEEKQLLGFGQSNAAMRAISRPEAFDENLRRRGAGMERVTVKLPHKYLATIGMELPKYATSIDGIETKGKFVCFYITIKPGESDTLRKRISDGSKGTGSVTTSSTKDIRKFQLVSTDILYKPLPKDEFSIHSPSFYNSMPHAIKSGSTTNNSTIVDDSLRHSSSSSSNNNNSNSKSETNDKDSIFKSTHPSREQNFINACSYAARGESKRLLNILELHPHLLHCHHHVTGKTLLHFSALSGDKKICELLIHSGVNPYTRDTHEKLACDLAREKALSYNNNSVDREDKNRYLYVTGLCNAKSIFRAVVEKDMLHLIFLVAYKKKEGILNSQNNNGMTALHFAVMYRRKEMVQWLTSQGADWYVSNNVGQTPLDILWDSVPSEEESTRVVLIEKQIEQCHKEEDRTRRISANALRQVREAANSFEKDAREKTLALAREAHAKSLKATEDALIRLDVSKAHMGEDVSKSLHDLIDARERGLQQLKARMEIKVPVHVPEKIPPWQHTSSPRRAAKHSVYLSDIKQKESFESRLTKDKALRQYHDGSSIITSSPMTGRRSSKRMNARRHSATKKRRPYTASTSYVNHSSKQLSGLSHLSSTTRLLNQRQNEEGKNFNKSKRKNKSISSCDTKKKSSIGNKKSSKYKNSVGSKRNNFPIKKRSSIIYASNTGREATMPWPPPVNSPLFEVWAESIGGFDGVDRALEREEREKRWSQLHPRKINYDKM